MSKLFFDHLVELKKIDKEIRKVAKTAEEREELWGIVDEIVHHKVIGCILDKLPRENHEEFLEIYHKSPHDSDVVFGYLREKTGGDMEKDLKEEIDKLGDEILGEIKSPARKK